MFSLLSSNPSGKISWSIFSVLSEVHKSSVKKTLTILALHFKCSNFSCIYISAFLSIYTKFIHILTDTYSFQIQIDICIYVCTYVRMYVYMYVCMYVCMYVRMYVCMCACICMQFFNCTLSPSLSDFPLSAMQGEGVSRRTKNNRVLVLNIFAQTHVTALNIKKLLQQIVY